MKRAKFELPVTGQSALKDQLLQLCREQQHASFLDSNNHTDGYSRFDWIAAIGSVKVLSCNENCFEQLKKFRQNNPDWLFGHLSYDLKNDLEKLSTGDTDNFEFAKLQFFVPETVVYAKSEKISVESYRYQSADQLLGKLNKLSPQLELESTNDVRLEPRTSREEYLEKVASLKRHLQYGNIYEINYCVEFSAICEQFEPMQAFKRLNESASAPFAGFYRSDDQFLLCSSPERYLQKSGSNIISQPIKGTARRSTDPVTDDVLKVELRNNEKEQSENVMITDLVRNDLSRTAKKGSVKVDELFGIYTFNTVHQMISTVSSELDERYELEDLLQTSFPMGSMTGAPKVSAMQLIEEHENFARSLYSGSVGYITPQGDGDFNVVIRSLMYNAVTGYLSARVGSAITIHCEAEREYEECLLKAENLFNSLEPMSVS